MKIAILIPSTTNNRDWNCITETYLWNSIISFISKYNPEYQYKFYVGVDKDDKIYTDKKQRQKIYDLCRTWKNVSVQFYPFDEDIPKGHVSIMWNILYRKAIEEHQDYFYITGDDIIYCSDGWLDRCITALKSTKNLGAAGCYNGNSQILTQFLVSQTHYAIFNFAYNPKITNWFVDNHLHELYSPNFLHIVEGACINAGGAPRYQIDDSAESFYKDLVEKDKEKLLCWLKTNGGYSSYLGNKRRSKKAKS
jgi:hypothetical protein